jgi:hypothetical protein
MSTAAVSAASVTVTAPAPAPGPSAAEATPAGAEALIWVVVYLIWVLLALAQAIAFVKAPCVALSGGGERGEPAWAVAAIGACLAAAFWLQTSGTRLAAQLSWHPALHVQVLGLFLGFGAVTLFTATHWHLGARGTRCAPRQGVPAFRRNPDSAFSSPAPPRSRAPPGPASAAPGTAWSPSVVVLPRQQLVTSGPYAAVRHPLYTSVLLVALFAFLAPGWLAVGGAFLALTVYFVAVRVPAEEALLAKAFPDEWRTHARRTGLLTPSFSWLSGAPGRGDCAAPRSESTPLVPQMLQEGDKAT